MIPFSCCSQFSDNTGRIELNYFWSSPAPPDINMPSILLLWFHFFAQQCKCPSVVTVLYVLQQIISALQMPFSLLVQIAQATTKPFDDLSCFLCPIGGTSFDAAAHNKKMVFKLYT